MPENYSSREAGIYGTSATKEYGQAKQEPVIAPEDPKIPVVPSISMNSTFGLVPQMFGNQFVPFWSSEPGACDTNLPNFVVYIPTIISFCRSFLPFVPLMVTFIVAQASKIFCLLQSYLLELIFCMCDPLHCN